LHKFLDSNIAVINQSITSFFRQSFEEISMRGFELSSLSTLQQAIEDDTIVLLRR